MYIFKTYMYFGVLMYYQENCFPTCQLCYNFRQVKLHYAQKIITSRTKSSSICTTHIFTVHLCLRMLHTFFGALVVNKLSRQPLKAVVGGGSIGFLSNRREGGNS